MFWLAEDHCVVAQGAASRDAEGRLDLYVRVRGLQSGAHAEPDAQRSPGVVRVGRGVAERRRNAQFRTSAARTIARKTAQDPQITQARAEFARPTQFFSSLLG